jgi:HK97 family phage prohead protease
MELRYISATEIRIGGTADAPTIEGIGIVYNSLSSDLGGFREIVKPGAVRNLSGGDIRGRYNHEMVLGRTKSGTMKLSDESTGVRYEITPPSTAAARHVVEAVRRGDVSGSSFAFRTISDNWRKENGETIRELTAIEISDIGPVDFPAYPTTSASVRDMTPDSDEFRAYAKKKIAELEARPNAEAVDKRLAEVRI